MPLIGRKSEEAKAAEAARNEQERATTAEKKRLDSIGRSGKHSSTRQPDKRASRNDHGDHVFQYSFDVMNQQAIIVSMVGSRTAKRTNDPVAVLNSVCHKGW